MHKSGKDVVSLWLSFLLWFNFIRFGKNIVVVVMGRTVAVVKLPLCWSRGTFVVIKIKTTYGYVVKINQCWVSRGGVAVSHLKAQMNCGRCSISLLSDDTLTLFLFLQASTALALNSCHFCSFSITLMLLTSHFISVQFFISTIPVLD